MRLAIEALGVKHGGAATVLVDILAAALADPRFERIFVFCPPKELRRFDLPHDDRIVPVDCAVGERNRLYRIWWLERRMPHRVLSLGCNVLICLNSYGRGKGVPHLTLIQNSLPFREGPGGGTGERLRLWAMRQAMRSSCRSSAAVIVQTETMRELVGRAFALPADRFRVVMPCVRLASPRQQPGRSLDAMRRAEPGQRVLYVGNAEPHKNAGVLLEAVAGLRARQPRLSLFLTWPGEHPASQQPGVFCVDYLDEADLAEAYSLADALVMPSLQETVGLPMLEAMNAGLPVIAADLPYAREVCRNAALFFDPRDAAGLASCLESVLTGPDLRARLIDEGRRLAEIRNAARPYEKMLDEAVSIATYE